MNLCDPEPPAQIFQMCLPLCFTQAEAPATWPYPVALARQDSHWIPRFARASETAKNARQASPFQRTCPDCLHVRQDSERSDASLPLLHTNWRNLKMNENRR